MRDFNFKTYELKLNTRKSKYFCDLFREAKWLTNDAIGAENIFNYDTKASKVSVKLKDSTEVRELKSLSAQMKQSIVYRLRDGIKALAQKKKKGVRIGRLKFKREINSIPLSNQVFRIKENKIKFQKNKQWFRIHGVEQLGESPNIRCAQLIRKPSGIYLHVTIAVPRKDEITAISDIGIDFGIKDTLTFSDGTKVKFSTDDQLKKIRKTHRNFSRKKKGSKNRYKAQKQLQKQYEKLNNIKKDSVNKLISALKHFRIVFQDEMISNWQRGLFGKQVQESILGRVKVALKKNTTNLEITRSAATTKTCFSCDKVNDIKLSDRVYHCDCGYREDRDIHSARNMLKFCGLEQTAVERESDLRLMLQDIQSKHLVMKQEAPLSQDNRVVHPEKSGSIPLPATSLHSSVGRAAVL